MRWVITGASRGIGLEFARQLAGRGDAVEAGARKPQEATDLRTLSEGAKGRIRVHACDVTDGASVASFSKAIGPDPIDALVNNAGVMGAMTSILDLDFADAAATFEANALGPMRVTSALVERVTASAVRKIVQITSGMGSIADNESGGAYGYRMSKAALNMANKSLSIDLKSKGACCVVMNPGWVQTRMGGSGASITVEESVRKMIAIIDSLGEKDSGRFLSWNGKDYPY